MLVLWRLGIKDTVLEHPESGQVVTLGRLTLKGKLGTCASRSLCHLPRGCRPRQRVRSGEQ